LVSSVAFSNDSARLAFTPYDRTAKIWDASSGKYLRTFGSRKALFCISLDATGLYLTEIGIVVFDASLYPSRSTALNPDPIAASKNRPYKPFYIRL
jgi:WD40 repeat protein